MAHAPQQAPYLLAHRAGDADEDYRLNKQFVIAKTDLYRGHSLHPTIVARLPHLNAVADLGCGSAIWLRDVSRTHFSNPSEQPTLVGWDVNPTSESASLNANHPGLQVFRHDCTQPIDLRWHARFDVVNIGSMAYALSQTSWPGFLENAYELLKPGGFLQWRDSENNNFVPIDAPLQMNRALELWSQERTIRSLVDDMPCHMISSVMFARTLTGQPMYQLEDFHLDCTNTPEALARDNVERHGGSDHLVLLATRAILRGRLLRVKDEPAHSEHSLGSRNEQVQELEQLDNFLDKMIQEQMVRFKCAFPQLIARKL